MKLQDMPLDKYQLALLKYIETYASSQAMSVEDAIRDILGDIEIICKNKNIDFNLALLRSCM